MTSWSLVFLSLLATVAGAPAATNELSGAELAGGQLAQQLLAIHPTEYSSLTGVLQIRDGKGRRSEIPIRVQAVIAGTNWQAVYETLPGTNNLPSVKLVVTHEGTNANRYELNDAVLTTPATNAFAGSDFSAADLGQEFFHWPGQRVVKKELRRSRACTVLESRNPDPQPGAYTRVLAWIDSETSGIVHAEAYDEKGELKDFDPKEFKKVKGQWQLQEMQIENVRTGSRTRLEFNLDTP